MDDDPDKPVEEQSPGGSVLKRYSPLEGGPQRGHADRPGEWQAQREAHYNRWFGTEALVSHEVPAQVPHVDVFVYPPSPEHQRDFYTLITSGMSDARMTLDARVPAHLGRAELLMYLPAVELKAGSTAQPWYMHVLRYLAHFPAKYKTWLGYGHSIPNGDPAEPFTPGSLLTTALLIAPFFEDSEFYNGLKLGDEPVNFLWVMPLTDDELAYKLEHGTEALLDRFEAVDFPRVLDVKRKSMLPAA